MSEQIVELSFYNESQSKFEKAVVSTSANAVEMPDGSTLSEKFEDITDKIEVLENKEPEGMYPVISETPPENPVDGQVWLKIVTIGGGGEA